MPEDKLIRGYKEFEFDLPGALLNNLVTIFDAMERQQLTKETVALIPEEQGVYQLFLDEALVYIGKTDAEAGLNKRLTRHSRKILDRKGLDPARVSFKAVRIFVFTAVDLESDLIRHYGGVKAVAWNNSGFGSNDPGRERDTTKNKEENFDFRYPADIDRPLKVTIEDPMRLPDYLAALKQDIPYTIRVARKGNSRKLNEELENLIIDPLKSPFTARQAIEHIGKFLSPEWQATKLLGYIIIYKEEKNYPQAEVLFPKPVE